jgi:hypothetical protein
MGGTGSAQEKVGSGAYPVCTCAAVAVPLAGSTYFRRHRRGGEISLPIDLRNT